MKVSSNFVSFKRSKIIGKVKIFNIFKCICINFDFYAGVVKVQGNTDGEGGGG